MFPGFRLDLAPHFRVRLRQQCGTARAEELIRKSLDLAETISDEYDVAICYLALADIQQAERQFAEAERDYRRAISLLSHHPEGSHALATAWRHLAEALIKETRYCEAHAGLKEASRLFARSKVEDPALNAQIHGTK
jgi:tetratricopeptide (TPR) repeat protein